MPSLIRFIVACAVLAGCVYGGMFALATFVEPNPREMTVRIPSDKLNVQQ
ncbi:MAG: histidine kinase [Rhizobiaceae bacterium]